MVGFGSVAMAVLEFSAVSMSLVVVEDFGLTMLANFFNILLLVNILLLAILLIKKNFFCKNFEQV